MKRHEARRPDAKTSASDAPDWHTKASEMLPEITVAIGEADEPMALWLKIFAAFRDAYDESRNDDFISRVYGFADWCLVQPRDPNNRDAGSDLLTSVVIAFCEDIPRHPAARADMPRWFTRPEILGNEHFFRHNLSDAEWEDLQALFPPPPSGKKKK